MVLGAEGVPASCKALEVLLCGRFLPLANVVDFIIQVWNPCSAYSRKRSILKPSFLQRGFIDFSAFPPDLIIVAIGFFS